MCEAESKDALPAPDVVTFHQVTRPSNSKDGLYTPALCFGDPRVMAVLASLVGFRHFVEGFNIVSWSNLRRVYSMRPIPLDKPLMICADSNARG